MRGLTVCNATILFRFDMFDHVPLMISVACAIARQSKRERKINRTGVCGKIRGIIFSRSNKSESRQKHARKPARRNRIFLRTDCTRLLSRAYYSARDFREYQHECFFPIGTLVKRLYSYTYEIFVRNGARGMRRIRRTKDVTRIRSVMIWSVKVPERAR